MYHYQVFQPQMIVMMKPHRFITFLSKLKFLKMSYTEEIINFLILCLVMILQT